MRDTDADWRSLAEAEPHFGVISNDRFLASNLTPQAIEDFFAGGREDVDFLVGELRRRWPDFAPRTATDFGCGVGRVSLAMLEYAPHVTGVDIAPAMLRVAADRAAKVGARLTLSSEIPPSADWIASVIVFQHIPPARGLPILERLLATLPAGGFASLHFTLHRAAAQVPELDARWVRCDGERLEVLQALPDGVGEMRMFDYDAGAILARFFDAGLTDPVVIQSDHGGHIGAWFLGRRHA
jgi:SAM-dependent methyltransferase